MAHRWRYWQIARSFLKDRSASAILAIVRPLRVRDRLLCTSHLGGTLKPMTLANPLVQRVQFQMLDSMRLRPSAILSTLQKFDLSA